MAIIIEEWSYTWKPETISEPINCTVEYIVMPY